MNEKLRNFYVFDFAQKSDVELEKDIKSARWTLYALFGPLAICIIGFALSIGYWQHKVEEAFWEKAWIKMASTKAENDICAVEQ
jgi:hypothetical protein